MAKNNRGTITSSFGSSGRVSHDATPYYNSKMYAGLLNDQNVEFLENKIPPDNLDRIFCSSSENMTELPDHSVHLMVTSPPYNVGKDYDQDLTLDDYLTFLKRVWCEVHRVLVPGGRVCINIANLGRKPYIPLHAFIVKDMLDLGFLMRGEVIWNKAASSAASTAWGSWLSPVNPTLRDIHEYILIFSKGSFGRNNKDQRQPTINKEEFLDFTKSVWTFPAESAKKVGHPAPFPVELPYRLIQLYTFEGDVVLDPFMGSGQTAMAAIKTNRHYIGYEIDEEYVKLAKKRIIEFRQGGFHMTGIKPTMSDEAVRAKTGKDWSEWFAILDTAGAQHMTHQEIVAHLVKYHAVGPWWQQMVTATYEQARGLRAKHEMPEGYQISRSKTFDLPVERLFAAWREPTQRASWLPDTDFTIRKQAPNKSLRITWMDGNTNVEVAFYPKGANRTQVTVQHNKLPDAGQAEKMKEYWGQALEKLGEVIT